MGNLRSELQRLAEAPPVPPPPVEELSYRAESIRRRRARLMSASAGVVMAAVLFAVVAPPDEPRATAVLAGGNGPASAAYVAKAPGGYRASGDWKLTIRRGEETIERRAGHSTACAPVGFIRPGDEVRGWVYGEDSMLEAGETAGC